MSRYQPIHISEEQVARLQRGDRQALSSVYQSLSRVIYGMALRILADPHEASVVTQDTFLKIMEKVPQLKDRTSFVAWARSIATNLCLMHIRSLSRSQTSSHIAPGDGCDVWESSNRQETCADIERALEGLTPETRMVIWMHEIEGYTHSEIGELFGRSESYSKSQLARGYACLKKTFQGEPQTEKRCRNGSA